tara:strand:- start:226 stop:603 length:378 start_codon:yes stop_codon:yes gene_type:complete
MAKFGNNMWGTGELNPTNFAQNGTYRNAVQAVNTPSGQTISDSFIGSPLAVSANSPPAGPIENSLRGMPAGYDALPVIGKITHVGASLAVGMAMSNLFGSNLFVGLVSSGISFALINEGVKGWIA